MLEGTRKAKRKDSEKTLEHPGLWGTLLKNAQITPTDSLDQVRDKLHGYMDLVIADQDIRSSLYTHLGDQERGEFEKILNNYIESGKTGKTDEIIPKK